VNKPGEPAMRPLGANAFLRRTGVHLENASDLMLLPKTRRTKHDQGFDRSASFTKVAVNLEIDVQRMRLNLRQSGFYAANRAGIPRLECQCCVLDTHVFPFLRDASARLEDARKNLLLGANETPVFYRPRWSGCGAPNRTGVLTLVV
jgi:hypothetical protein